MVKDCRFGNYDLHYYSHSYVLIFRSGIVVFTYYCLYLTCRRENAQGDFKQEYVSYSHL